MRVSGAKIQSRLKLNSQLNLVFSANIIYDISSTHFKLSQASLALYERPQGKTMSKKTQPQDHDFYFAVSEALLRQQRKSRFLAMSVGFKPGKADAALSFGEGLLLLIVQSEPDRSIGEIASQLGLERSWVSRMIASLEKRQLLTSGESGTDKRIRNVRITRKGTSELAQLAEARARIITETFKPLSQDEQKDLRALLKKLADGLHAPQYSQDVRSHPIDVELARISWMLGVIGENFNDSGMSDSKYQVLYELARRKGEYVSPSDVGKLLPVNLSSVSRLLASLESEGLIERKLSKEDGRVSLLRISRHGVEAWEEVRERGTQQIANALKGVPLSDVKRLSMLIMKATADFVGKLSHHPRKATEIRPLRRSEIEELLSGEGKQSGSLKALGHLLAEPPSGKLFGMFEKKSLKAVMRIEKGGADDFEFRDIALCGSSFSEKEFLRFVRVSLQAVSSGLV